MTVERRRERTLIDYRLIALAISLLQTTNSSGPWLLPQKYGCKKAYAQTSMFEMPLRRNYQINEAKAVCCFLSDAVCQGRVRQAITVEEFAALARIVRIENQDELFREYKFIEITSGTSTSTVRVDGPRMCMCILCMCAR